MICRYMFPDNYTYSDRGYVLPAYNGTMTSFSGRRSQSLFSMCYAQAQRSTVTWTTCTFVLFRCFMPSAMRKYCDAATICERGVMYMLTVFIWKKTQLLTMLFQTYSLKISMQQRKLPPSRFD